MSRAAQASGQISSSPVVGRLAELLGAGVVPVPSADVPAGVVIAVIPAVAGSASASTGAVGARTAGPPVALDDEGRPHLRMDAADVVIGTGLADPHRLGLVRAEQPGIERALEVGGGVLGRVEVRPADRLACADGDPIGQVGEVPDLDGGSAGLPRSGPRTGRRATKPASDRLTAAWGRRRDPNSAGGLAGLDWTAGLERHRGRGRPRSRRARIAVAAIALRRSPADRRSNARAAPPIERLHT